jgi:predicted deacylase
MKGYFAFGGTRALPGEKTTGFLNVPDTSVKMPLTVINGTEIGPTLLMIAGIHGGEYTGIEAAIQFASELEPKEVSGQVIVIPIVSLNSFYARQEYTVPEDGKNLNRQFPGNPAGTISERMAFALMIEAASKVNAWVNLHSGDIHEALLAIGGYESAGEPSIRDRSREMIEVFGLEYAACNYNLPGTTLSAATAAAIPSIIAEAGQMGLLGEEDIALLLRGCRNVARLIGILPGPPVPVRRPKMLERIDWVVADQRGCWYPLVKVGESIERAQIAGVIKDLFGNTIAEYGSPSTGIVVLSCTSLAVREHHRLFGVGVPA